MCARLLQIGTNSFLCQLVGVTELDFPKALMREALSAEVEEFPKVLRLCQAR